MTTRTKPATWRADVLRFPHPLSPSKVTHWEYREFRDEVRVARRPGKCSLCGGAIRAGDTTRAVTSWLDGEVGTLRYCELCCDAMATQDDGEALEARFR